MHDDAAGSAAPHRAPLSIAAAAILAVAALIAFRREPVVPANPPHIQIPVPKPLPPPDTLRGGESASEATLSPYNETVSATRPLFTWSATEGATYVVTIATENHDVVETSARLTEPRWQPSRELQPGSYLWQVKVERKGVATILPSPDQPPARFQLAEPSSTKPAQ